MHTLPQDQTDRMLITGILAGMVAVVGLFIAVVSTYAPIDLGAALSPPVAYQLDDVQDADGVDSASGAKTTDAAIPPPPVLALADENDDDDS